MEEKHRSMRLYNRGPTGSATCAGPLTLSEDQTPTQGGRRSPRSGPVDEYKRHALHRLLVQPNNIHVHSLVSKESYLLHQWVG